MTVVLFIAGRPGGRPLRILREDVVQKLTEAALGIDRDILLLLIEQAVCEEKYLHTGFGGDHVFCCIVSDHQAFFRLDV